MTYKLLSYETAGGPRAGILIGDTVLNAEAASGNPKYRTVLAILDDWDAADQLFTDIAQGHLSGKGSIPLGEARLLAPILYPGQIWAAGANYADHIEEMSQSEFPAVDAKKIGGRPWHFSKSSRSAVVGPDSRRPLPPYSRKVDWEVELAVVIGRAATRVLASRALDYVAGYTIANDLSARDFVARDGIATESPFRFDWLSHKGFDGACPMGPWITPARAISDPQDLGLKLWVDDELMQDSRTSFMIFSIAEQIEEISARVTMNPGDVILTGTPSGIGMNRGIFLKSGQSLRLWIENIGELRHSFE
jgi:2-keto-4-pentenoate hydratase/2-oxohepta-3-ene-1,7-dioic acid hydratase in catechol pathway